MLNITRRTNLLSIIVLVMWSTPSLAVPIGSASFSGIHPVEGVIVTINGTGFGSKNQAAPILYDFSDKAYVNGTLDNSQGSLPEGSPMLRDSPGFYWSKPSNTSFGASPVLITYAQAHRHDNITAHYTFNGFSGFLGWPYAYGGTTTTGNNEKLYISAFA